MFCDNCHTSLPDDPSLPKWMNRVRGWLWLIAHQLNCPTSFQM